MLLIAILVGLAILAGLILLIIPGIMVVGDGLSVAIPALVFEDKRGTAALSRSWELVKGSFWHVLGTVFLASLITGFVSGILHAVGGTNWAVYWILDVIARQPSRSRSRRSCWSCCTSICGHARSRFTADTLRSELTRNAA